MLHTQSSTQNKIYIENSTKSFNFLGKSTKERAKNLQIKIHGDIKENLIPIYEYIMAYYENALINPPYMKDLKKGLNLAKHPFLTPSFGPTKFYQEQYRWDTYFINEGLITFGAFNIAIEQLLNLSEAYKNFGRIPNALTTEFLTHSQPPLETSSALNILSNNDLNRNNIWAREIFETAEKEIFSEWFDIKEGRKVPRMTQDLIKRYGFLTRHVNAHFDPMLVGCEDGKDHNFISSEYGTNYFPVQINTILYKVISDIIKYYTDYIHNAQKVNEFKILQNELYKSIQSLMWTESDNIWKGFFNYKIGSSISEEGHIFYNDISTEIFPLWSGIATKHQSEIILNNLEKYYETDFGLVTSTKLNRDGTQKPPTKAIGLQWEYPNIWPPLMQTAIEGLLKYGYNNTAVRLMKKWTSHIEEIFKETGLIYEKYSCDKSLPDLSLYGGQKGFGWTIGGYLWMSKYLHEYKSIEEL